MIDFNGDAVQIDDTVHLDRDRSDIIVGIIDEDQYEDGYNATDWDIWGVVRF